MDLQPHPDVHHLACIGLMGAGKTTVGSQVAERLGWSFVDVDALLEARTGCSVGELWQAGGEDGYRPLERDVVAGALDRKSVVEGQRVSVGVESGGRRDIKKKKQ